MAEMKKVLTESEIHEEVNLIVIIMEVLYIFASTQEKNQNFQKMGIGKRMGGGKPNVHHYASPVKAGRIVIEVGGRVEFSEVFPFLNRVAKKMPFDAMPISHEILQQLEKEADDLHKKNINPFSFRHVVQNDMQGCNMWTSPWDLIHHGDYI